MTACTPRIFADQDCGLLPHSGEDVLPPTIITLELALTQLYHISMGYFIVIVYFRFSRLNNYSTITEAGYRAADTNKAVSRLDCEHKPTVYLQSHTIL